jgi:hypothetical protein
VGTLRTGDRGLVAMRQPQIRAKERAGRRRIEAEERWGGGVESHGQEGET